MDKGRRDLAKQTIIYLLLGMLAVSSTALARSPRRNDTGRDESRKSEKELRKEEMRREASKSFPEVNKALTEILEKVAKNQRPQPATIEKASKLLEDNKRNALVYDDSQKAKYMLLQAWTGFCQDDPVRAVNWSMRACKSNDASQDAWISRALFNMLVGRPPMLPRIDKPQPEQQQRNRRRSNFGQRRNNDGMMGNGGSKPQPYSEQGILKFDLPGLNSRMFREQFGHLRCMAADGSEVEFVPGQDMLCMLFWQGDAKTADANDISGGSAGEADEMTPAMGTGGSAGTNMQSATLQAQQKYFRVLMDACQDNPEIKFMQVNTMKPKNLEAFLNDLPDYSSESIPTVIAAAPNSNAQQFVGWDAKKPFMVIVDKTGKVKYAGPAAGFMPAFILTESTGVEIDLEEQDQPAMSDQTDSPMFEEETTKPALTPIRGFRPLQPGEPKEPVADPNSPMADPNEIVSDPNGITTVQPNKQIKKPEFPKGPAKPAAILKGLTWVKGKPVKFQPGKIYVVEFWATWCPPCKKSIPHLTEIQRKYKDKDVTVIGITNETEINTIKRFVAQQGDKMDYTVAVDKTSKVAAAYMQAYQQKGIPAAFVVDRSGRVVWYGHPMKGLDAVLEYLVSETPDTDIVVTSPTAPAETEPFTMPSTPKQPSESPALPLEDQMRAEKLLTSAKMHIEESRKLRMKNPKKGIEDARQILKEFPNTEYAQQARELLRRVPSRWKERHGITDEEQGI